jgi:hypothetical protein
MPVQFAVTIKNFSSKQMDVHLEARNEATGKDMQEVNFNPQNPVKLMPASVTTVTFEQRFQVEKPGEPTFAHVSVRLVNQFKQPLTNDGLLPDNIRYAVVEVRDKVPILVIDGAGPAGREESKDSFFVRMGLISVPGKSYDIVFGDELAPGNATAPTKVLERADLNKFPTIFMLNVNSLTPKQTTNLENYVREGGGVAFFMGPLVNAKWYNDKLYKDGKGMFPAPLRPEFYPAPNDKELEAKGASDTDQLIIREEKFATPVQTPIFGAMFADPKNKQPLRALTIRRYFKVAEGLWKPDPGRIFELATLPNDALAATAGAEVAPLLVNPAVSVKAIMANKELAKYHAALQGHLKRIAAIAAPDSDKKAYHLAAAIDALMNDRGGDKTANMTDFWSNPDSDVQTLRAALLALRERVNYGDPFVLSANYGKGKTVAVLSTAGKDWNDWAGGSLSQILYPMFIWETQNYLSSQGSEANLTVGKNVDLDVDAEQFRAGRPRLERVFKKPKEGAPAVDVKVGEPEASERNGQLHFEMTKNFEPGIYISTLFDSNNNRVATYAHAFNVDTEREGDLTRVGDADLERVAAADPNIIVGDDRLVSQVNDFSGSPWLFLAFLFVLVAEQALAVHLSFHMKASDDQLAPAGAGGKAPTV